MRSITSRTFLALIIVLLIAVGLAVLRYFLQERDLAVLRETFGGEVSALCNRPPQWIPESFVDWCYERVVGLTEDEDKRTEVRSIVFRVLGGHFDTASIDMTSVPADPGDALRRLSQVETLWIDARASSKITEADGTSICRAVRAMTAVRRLRLDGPQAFTDTSLASLASHPNLQRVILFGGSITRASIPTFSSLPSLTDLRVPATSGGLTQEDYRAIRAALHPKVVVIRP
ncbi:hypothetical protein AYO49_06365 [Verrucomicrobiaceae bacterium SCGC AG-212-N21]|nr:hypothetical protein AYO49_06365 [Verrucomicrobiaceae bacterium SCGC AG-212-N21]